ncbi:MAG: LysE family translocator [Pseudomonadota bacterium]
MISSAIVSVYALTWLSVIATQISPGPNLAAVASVGLAQGRRPALFVVTGISSGMLVWSLATAMGLGTLIEAFPWALTLMKLLGGGYLLFLAIKAARTTWRGTASPTYGKATEPLSDAQAWRRGALVLLSNPKAALMWAAVASFLFGQGLSVWHVLVLGPLGALSGLLVYGTYAWLFSTGVAMRGYTRFAGWFEGVFAAVFGLMGASLLWAGIRDVRN